MSAQKRVAILSSTRTGGTAHSLIKASQGPQSPFKVVLAVADRHNAGILEFAKAAGIEGVHHGKEANVNHEAYERSLVTMLKGHEVDIICLAGFYRVLTYMMLFKPWHGNILNIHPSLKYLPRMKSTGGKGMYGPRVHEEVLRLGGPTSGCVVHMVTRQLDGGPVFASKQVELLPDDTIGTLAERVHNAELELYPYALKLFCSGRFTLDAEASNILLEGRISLPREGQIMPKLPATTST